MGANGVHPHFPQHAHLSIHQTSSYILFGQVLPPQNRFALCVSTFCYGIEKRCRFNSPILLLSDIKLSCAFWFYSAPLSRLTPIEALPQAPQGTLSLDPASPLTPGLSLRFISRYARCWGTALVSYAHSSFLIPH